MSAGQWPDLDSIKRLVDVDPTDSNWDVEITDQLNAAITLVKDEVGNWDDLLDVPDAQLAGAARRAAFLLSLKESPAQILRDPVFATFMHGKHRRFPFS